MTTCEFTLAHYGDTLRAALEQRRRFLTFSDPPASGAAVYLRHDVDFSLAHAEAMANLEAALGVRSTYFVQCNTPFYNLFEDGACGAVERIHAAGHTIGLHLDERSRRDGEDLSAFADRIHTSLRSLLPLSRTISFHRPTGTVLGQLIPGFVSAYESRFMGEGRYLSDSRKQWRAGCLCTRLASAPNGVQVLVHPEWWNRTDLPATSIGDDILTAKLDALHEYMNANCQPFRGTVIERHVALTF